MDLSFACLLSYLLGSVPFALLMVRLLAGVDVRSIGSGNVGATNASRAFKKARIPVFLLIYVLDFGKGLVPTLYFGSWLGAEGLTAQVLIGAAAILGHCTSPFLGFRGGKGVATSTGVFAVLTPIPLVCALGVFFALLLSTKKVYLGSLGIGLTLAIGSIIDGGSEAFGARLPVTVLCLLLAAFLFYTHRNNLRGHKPKQIPA